MDDIWTKSKWSESDLDRKTVELWVPAYGSEVQTIGEFQVKSKPKEGLISVSVLVEFQEKAGETIQWRGYLPQGIVDRIEYHPDQSLAAFQIIQR